MKTDEWKQRAACHGKTDIFFAPHRERPAKRVIREAQAYLICSSCPVQAECEEASVGEVGFWAGKERNAPPSVEVDF